MRCVPRRRVPTITRPDGVYLMAFETRFWSSRRSRRRSERTVSEDGTNLMSRPRSRAIGSNSRCSWRNDLVDAETRPLRFHGAGVETRDIQQGREDFLDRVERGVDVLGERGVARILVALDERTRIEARGIEGLQDVVAGGGEEPRLGDIRLVGLGLGAGQRFVEPGQLLGALAYPLFQGLVRAPAFLLGGDGVGHIRIGRDEAAIGQLVRADLDDLAGGMKLRAEPVRDRAGRSGCARDQFLDTAPGP